MGNSACAGDCMAEPEGNYRRIYADPVSCEVSLNNVLADLNNKADEQLYRIKHPYKEDKENQKQQLSPSKCKFAVSLEEMESKQNKLHQQPSSKANNKLPLGEAKQNNFEVPDLSLSISVIRQARESCEAELELVRAMSGADKPAYLKESDFNQRLSRAPTFESQNLNQFGQSPTMYIRQDRPREYQADYSYSPNLGIQNSAARVFGYDFNREARPQLPPQPNLVPESPYDSQRQQFHMKKQPSGHVYYY